MKTFKPALLLFVSIFFFASCEKAEELTETLDETVCESNYDAVDEAITAFENAFLEFTQDPSVANCEAYRTELIAYTEEAEDLIDCLTLDTNRQQIQEALDLQKQSLDALECE